MLFEVELGEGMIDFLTEAHCADVSFQNCPPLMLHKPSKLNIDKLIKIC